MKSEMYSRYIKRFFDILLSLLSMPAVGLAVVFVAPAIWLNDRGPVFYNATRMGMNGKIFRMYKFRSMKVNSPDLRTADGSTYNSDSDPRLTKVGRILRKLSVDEVPQMVNVLKGDMSFIGPRPILGKGVYEDFDEIRKKRLTVRPGITGYSQAYFRNSISKEQKFLNDVYYVEHLSLLFDLRILFRTVFSVFSSKNIFVEVPEAVPVEAAAAQANGAPAETETQETVEV